MGLAYLRHPITLILTKPERSHADGVRMTAERSTGWRHSRKAAHEYLLVVFLAGKGHQPGTDRDAFGQIKPIELK